MSKIVKETKIPAGLNTLYYLRENYSGLLGSSSFFLINISGGTEQQFKICLTGCAEHDKRLELFELLKHDGFICIEQLTDMFAVDKLGSGHRFELVYVFLSLTSSKRMCIRNPVPSSNGGHFSFSITSLFKSADWFEREIWDMFGVIFLNHPDLRRLLTDYGFDGFPLRKDFPAIGYKEVRYDSISESIVEEPVSLTQEFRYFDFIAPWVKTDDDATKS